MHPPELWSNSRLCKRTRIRPRVSILATKKRKLPFCKLRTRALCLASSPGRARSRGKTKSVCHTPPTKEHAKQNPLAEIRHGRATQQDSRLTLNNAPGPRLYAQYVILTAPRTRTTTPGRPPSSIPPSAQRRLVVDAGQPSGVPVPAQRTAAPPAPLAFPPRPHRADKTPPAARHNAPATPAARPAPASPAPQPRREQGCHARPPEPATVR